MSSAVSSAVTSAPLQKAPHQEVDHSSKARFGVRSMRKLVWLKPHRDSSRYASLIEFGRSFLITKERLAQVQNQKHHRGGHARHAVL